MSLLSKVTANKFNYYYYYFLIFVVKLLLGESAMNSHLEEKELLQLSKSALFMHNCQCKCVGGLKLMNFT